MTLVLDIRGAWLEAVDVVNLRQTIDGIHSLLQEVAERSKVPDVEITLIIADDFAAEVRQVLSATGNEGAAERFGVERIGGQVAAKNLPTESDWSRVSIVFDSAFMRDGDGLAGATRVMVLAHELSHPVLLRSRSAAGLGTEPTSELVVGDSADETARWIVTTLADEFRADIIASCVLQALVKLGDGDARRPARIFDLYPTYLAAPGIFLEDAYPRWPDLVERQPLDVGLVWSTIVNETSQLLTSLAHGQATADMADLPGPLELPNIASLPATRLYLAEPWARIREVLASMPVLPTPEQFANNEDRFVSEASAAVFDIWASLGVHPQQLPDGRLWISVTAPNR